MSCYHTILQTIPVSHVNYRMFFFAMLGHTFIKVIELSHVGDNVKDFLLKRINAVNAYREFYELLAFRPQKV